jgi:hypothetical protein
MQVLRTGYKLFNQNVNFNIRALRKYVFVVCTHQSLAISFAVAIRFIDRQHWSVQSAVKERVAALAPGRRVLMKLIMELILWVRIIASYFPLSIPECEYL